MKTLVFIPTYNERENIEGLIDEIFKLGLDLNVLVVDDSSLDGTAEALDRIAEANSKVSVMHRQGKRGRGLAGIEGFKYALGQGADYIIEMDADFSHDPKYIPVFLKEISDCDVVIGSRWIKGGSVSGRSWYRNYLSLFAKLFCCSLIGLTISDATSGYRCFRRRALEKLDFDGFLSSGPSIVEEVNLYLERNKFKVKEVPIVFMPRYKGVSKLNPLKIWETFWTLAKVRVRRQP
jgi:dolichol-phosphate mannosyltransferase